MKKSTEIFLTSKDEQEFETEMKKLFPNICFIDGFSWETEDPPEKKSIVECESKFVRIWNKDLYPTFTKYDRGNSEIPNPPTLVTIRMIRTSQLDPTTIIPKENILVSGTLSVAVYEEYPKSAEMINFVEQVWKILRKITTKKLSVVHPQTGSVINDKPFNVMAGKDAVNWCNEDTKRYLKFHSVQAYMKPTLK